MTGHVSGMCRPVIEHGIEIVNIKKEQCNMHDTVENIGKTANKIFIAVFVSLLSVLAHMILL